MECIECNKTITNEKDNQEQLNNATELPMCKECTINFNYENGSEDR